MKCSPGISNFLEEISSLLHSIIFLYVFALITEEGFLISPYYSLEKMKLLSRVQLFVTPRIIAYQASPSMGFFRQEYWSGLPSFSRGSSRPRDQTRVSCIVGRCFCHLNHQGRFSLELCIQMVISFLFSFAFHSLLFSSICKASSDNHLAFCISFSWGWS